MGSPESLDALFAACTTLDIQRDGPVLRVWLDRPAKRNAISTVMLREIGDVFHALEHEHEAKVVVLGGKGVSFSGGADRDPQPDPAMPTTERGKRWHTHLGRRACRAIEASPIPTVARVQGHAIGGGMCFAVACDFRISTSSAVWWLPEIELGVPLTWAAIPRLIQEVGAARARQMVMMAERFDGAQAERWGVAHEAIDEAQLDEIVERWVQRLASLPEIAVHMTKTTFRGYDRLHSLGDVSESDADLLQLAQLDPAVAAAFGREPRS